MHLFARAPAAGHARVGAHDRLVRAYVRCQQRFDLLHLLHGVVVAGAFRAVDHDLERTTVFGRGQFRRQHFDQQPAGRQRSGHHQQVDPRAINMMIEHAPIGAGQAFQIAVDEAVQPARCLPGMRLEQLGGHHRRQRQRDERRQRDSGGQGDRQFTEQAPGIAFQEADRQEYRHQHGGGGDHRERHLRGAPLGRHQRRFAQVDAALHVFHHHDRVIHHQADAQHQRQQGQQVDREVERVQRDERRHQAHRHGDRRNQRRAEAAEEQPDHRQHQDHRLHQGGVHAVDGSLDEGGVVEGNEDLRALGQGQRDAFGLGARGACYIQ